MDKFEQSALPRSLFTVDGSLHKTRGKDDIASEMRKLYSDEIERSMVTDDDPSQEKVIIFDAMKCLLTEYWMIRLDTVKLE